MRSLEERLRTLRPGRRPPPADPDVQALAERIGRLRSGRPLPPEEAVDAVGLEQRLGASRPAPGVLLLEQALPLSTRHGRLPLAALRRPVSRLQPAGDWLFLDTETTGLAGGTGSLAFMVGLARIEGESLRLRQYLLTGFAGEAAMLDLLLREIGGGETLATYNGKSFDLPLLATRLRLHGRDNPLAGLPHLDLLHPVRRRFARDWPDCRLATVERRLLGCGRQGDLPGAAAPAAWLAFLRGGQWRRLAAVARHNRLDLLALAVLVPALEEPERTPPLCTATTPGRDPGRIRALRRALAAAG